MLKFAKKISFLVIIVSIISTTIFCVGEFGFSNVYKNNYQKGWVYQYRAIQNADRDKNKIILFGSSYLTFGVDIDRLSQETGMPVYALGIHSGMGMNYVFETVEKFTNEGDIVVFPFLYVDEVDYGMDLINISLDNEPDLYFDFFKEHPLEVLRGAGKATYRKLYQTFHDLVKGQTDDNITVYDARAFDPSNGNLIYDRPSCIADDETLYDWDYDFNKIDPTYIAQVSQIIDMCDEKGASFYMAYAPIIYSSVTSSKDEIQEYTTGLKNTFDVPFIFDLEDVFVTKKYVYDLPMHMNNTGKVFYTDMIYNGLSQYVVFTD